jgi:uncharacterized protein (TIGR00106 family)
MINMNGAGQKYKVIIQFSITPLGKGVSISDLVAEAIKEVKKSGLKYQLTPMATILEADDLGEALEVIQKAHKAVLIAGAKRVLMNIQIDDRRDKSRRMEDKVEKVKSLIGKVVL